MSARFGGDGLSSVRGALIGPGRLVLVVGPSGAGKDTLIDGVRAACAEDPSMVFPRRVVTRAATPAEDHDTLSEDAFRRAAAAGGFALWWEAHGLCYGLPCSIDGDIRFGRTVICNVSRTIVGQARSRYAALTVVNVTAPPHILEARLASRGRASDGNTAERVARSAVAGQGVAADVVIENVGTPEAGVRRLHEVVRELVARSGS
jgi:ribose 1,5-bisphosphokinase